MARRPQIRVSALLERIDEYIKYYHLLGQPVPKRMMLTDDQYRAVVKKLGKPRYRELELYSRSDRA